MSQATQVSILVLMDRPLKPLFAVITVRIQRCFNPCFNGSSSQTLTLNGSPSVTHCFNPCFNGSSSQTLNGVNTVINQLCFNPCFNGSSSQTLKRERDC